VPVDFVVGRFDPVQHADAVRARISGRCSASAGLTGLPLGWRRRNIYLHELITVIAHFHYVVAPGTIFAFVCGHLYWFPKMTGRMMNESGVVCISGDHLFSWNVVFMPMFAQGMEECCGAWRRRG